MREVKETGEKSPGFADTPLARKAAEVVQGGAASEETVEGVDRSTIRDEGLATGRQARCDREAQVRASRCTAAVQAAGCVPTGTDAIPVGSETRRHQQRRRTGLAPGGDNAKITGGSRSRQARRLGQAGQPLTNRRSKTTRRVRRNQKLSSTIGPAGDGKLLRS